MSVDPESKISAINATLGSITAQANWLAGISLAVVGGLVALLLQIAMHNAQHTHSKFYIDWKILLIICFMFEMTSILFGYFVQGNASSLYFALYNHDIDPSIPLVKQDIVFLKQTRILSLMQALLFIFGIILIIIFAIKNAKLLKGSSLSQNLTIKTENGDG